MLEHQEYKLETVFSESQSWTLSLRNEEDTCMRTQAFTSVKKDHETLGSIYPIYRIWGREVAVCPAARRIIDCT